MNVVLKRGRLYIIVTVSGGKTSAYQAIWMTQNKQKIADYFRVPVASIEYIYVFCNTGREEEETLRFVDMLDREYFDNQIIWLEAVINHGKGNGTTHRITNYKDAHRKHEYETRRDTHPFTQFMAKFGIPNQTFKSCTRELKLRPQDSYCRSIGLKTGNKSRKHYTAIGYRTDEAERRATPVEQAKTKQFYPLLDIHPSDKEDVNIFWEDQPDTLRLPSYRGNCITCFKKSKNKLNMVYIETPGDFDFNQWAEVEFPFIGAEFDLHDVKTPRKQFREQRNTGELIAIFRPVEEISNLKHFVRDTPGDCTQECNFSSVFSSEEYDDD